MEEKTQIRIDVRTFREPWDSLTLEQIPNHKRVVIRNISDRLMKEFSIKEETFPTMEAAMDHLKKHFPESQGWKFEQQSDEAYLFRKV